LRAPKPKNPTEFGQRKNRGFRSTPCPPSPGGITSLSPFSVPGWFVVRCRFVKQEKPKKTSREKKRGAVRKTQEKQVKRRGTQNRERKRKTRNRKTRTQDKKKKGQQAQKQKRAAGKGEKERKKKGAEKKKKDQ